MYFRRFFFYGIFNLFGIVRTFYYSTMEWKGISANMTFLGLQNYIAVAQDPQFWNALKNNLILVLVSTFIQMPGALLLALLINANLKGTKIFPYRIFYADAALHSGDGASCGFCFMTRISDFCQSL